MARKPLSLHLQEVADSASQRLADWERVLLLFPSEQEPFIEDDFVGRELKAACVVAIMAELEHFLVETLVGLGEELNLAAIKVKDIRPSLRPLAGEPHFASLATSSNSENIYHRRESVTTMDTSEDYAQFPGRTSKGPQPPLDGKTITGVHIARIWKVIGAEGDPFPSANAETALRKLASMRNDIAHRNVPPTELFKQPDTSAAHIVNYLGEVRALFSHLARAWSAYARNGDYRVP